MATLVLDLNERAALMSALENYLDGHGMPQRDEDEPVLESILERLA